MGRPINQPYVDIHEQNPDAKGIISLQLPNFAIEWLKRKARNECTTVSYLIRRSVLQMMMEDEKDGR